MLILDVAVVVGLLLRRGFAGDDGSGWTDVRSGIVRTKQSYSPRTTKTPDGRVKLLYCWKGFLLQWRLGIAGKDERQTKASAVLHLVTHWSTY